MASGLAPPRLLACHIPGRITDILPRLGSESGEPCLHGLPGTCQGPVVWSFPFSKSKGLSSCLNMNSLLSLWILPHLSLEAPFHQWSLLSSESSSYPPCWVHDV